MCLVVELVEEASSDLSAAEPKRKTQRSRYEFKFMLCDCCEEE